MLRADLLPAAWTGFLCAGLAVAPGMGIAIGSGFLGLRFELFVLSDTE